MDILKAPITAKLMILRVGGYNFRSLGVFSKEQPYHIVDFTKIGNLLVGATGNGSGKSTLYKHLLDYCLTGQNSVEGDILDALINSNNKKKGMSTFIEVFSHGSYYRCVRGRGKLKSFDIYKLVGREWVEIPNLPTKDSERQAHWYSLLGLDKNSAEVVISNTISLGTERFRGLLSMKSDERRKLMEPIFGVTIFSDMNKEVKSKKSKVLDDQKLTLLEINELSTKEALSEQSVTHTKQELSTLETNYKAQQEVLQQKVNKYTVEKENALQLDTDGNDLHRIFEEESEAIAKDKIELESKLEKDLANLGEFKLDEDDLKLINLEANYLQVDYDISVVKKQLKDKEDSLGDEVKTEISTLKVLIADKKVNHNAKLADIEAKYKEESSAVDKQISIKKEALVFEEEKLKLLESKLKQSEVSYEEYKNLQTVAKEKETKYKVNLDKMVENLNYLKNKEAVEEHSLSLLNHAGVCESCGQDVTEEYLIEARKGVQERLDVIQSDIDLYSDRICKGEFAILELGLDDLDGKVENTLYSVASCKEEVDSCKSLINTYTSELERLTSVQADNTRQYVQAKKDASLQLSNDILILKNKLDNVENEVAKTLGKYQAKLDQLLETADSRKEVLLGQIEDRKVAMGHEHAGKETNLKGVYKADIRVLDNKLQYLKDNLTRELAKLKEDKDKVVVLAEGNLEQVKGDLHKVDLTYKNSFTDLQDKLSKYEKEINEITNKLNTSKSLHDRYEQDIIDYNHILQLISDDEGKAEVLRNYMKDFNKDVNSYLNAMELYLDVTIDETFGITMSTENREGQTLHSLSVGQKARLNLAIMLSLRDVSNRLSGVDCNILILDEVLNPFHEDEVPTVIEMLKSKFTELSLVVISQNKSSVEEYFEQVKTYKLQGGFTTEIVMD